MIQPRRYPLRHDVSCLQWLFWFVYFDVELREDITNPHNGYCADNYHPRQFILQDDKLLSGKSLSAEQLSYGKFRIWWGRWVWSVGDSERASVEWGGANRLVSECANG